MTSIEVVENTVLIFQRGSGSALNRIGVKENENPTYN